MGKDATFYNHDLAHIHHVVCAGLANGAAPGLLNILRRAGIDQGRIVDLGCGSGIWAKHLVDAGYQVVGVDISPAMITLARRQTAQARFHVGSLWSYQLPACRAITALGEVLCYRNDDRLSQGKLDVFFRRAHQALQPDGLLIFDVAEVGLDRSRPPTFTKGDDFACLVQFHYDNKRNQLVRQITSFRQTGRLYRRQDERHVVQLFDRVQVAQLLRESGFTVRTTKRFGDQPLFPGRRAFIARKST